MTDEAPNARDRSLGELLAELTREFSTLVRQEAALAKAEMSQKLSRVWRDAAFVAAGGAIAYAGFLALLAGIIIWLAESGLPWYGSALLVGVVVLAVGLVLVFMGINAFKREDLVPRQTLEALTTEERNAPNAIRGRAA